MRTTSLWACVVAVWAAVVSMPAAAQPPRELAKWLGPQRWEKDVAGPILSLGAAGEFDDMHIFAPAVIQEKDRFLLWYCGARGTRSTRVFRLGLATSKDGKAFERHRQNPVLGFTDGIRSVLTPALLRSGDGSVLREDGKLRMWHSAANLAKGGLHTLHETTSADGIHWAQPSPPLLDHVYCPTILKTERGYEMWYSDVSKRPWVIRHAASADGRTWKVTERPVLQLSQDWEAEIVVYPTVLKIDGVYLMWYGSYYSAVRRQTTAVGFAASLDGLHWHKHPQNPVLIPDPKRPWESNYVGSGCVARLADGSFRAWYASRKAPPFENLYFALNTARWAGPTAPLPPLPLPPKKGDKGTLLRPLPGNRAAVEVLEVVGKQDAILRAWHPAATTPAADPAAADLTFVDLWVHGIDTSKLSAGAPANLSQVFHVTGNKLFDTTCGKRSLPLLEPVDAGTQDAPGGTKVPSFRPPGCLPDASFTLWSIFLTRLVKGSLSSRTKIRATMSVSAVQTGQRRSPVPGPVTNCGKNAPRLFRAPTSLASPPRSTVSGKPALLSPRDRGGRRKVRAIRDSRLRCEHAMLCHRPVLAEELSNVRLRLDRDTARLAVRV